MLRKAKRAWRLLLIVAILVAMALVVFMHDTYSPPVADGAYEWRFSEQGSQEAPKTGVMLVAGEKSHDLGEYNGSCAVEHGDYLEYEKSKVICWSILGGHEIGVFEEPGQTVVRVGDFDEGVSGVPGFRGNFVLLKRI